MHFERLYDESETTKVRFVGFVSDKARYDFGIVYTRQFFGKPLVICMQTGRSTLLCSEEAANVDYLQKIFQINDQKEAEQLSYFFQKHLPSVSIDTQY
ncbi:DUF3055 domain-containing protein [Bacillaceae bacterium]